MSVPVIVGKARLPRAVRDVRDLPAVHGHAHAVGLEVDRADVRVADREARGDVLLAPPTLAEVDAGQVRLHLDLGVGRPVVPGAVVHLGVGEPVPGPDDRHRRGDAEPLLDGGLVRDVVVEAHGDRLADAHDLVVAG
jgi:hypothetical protein